MNYFVSVVAIKNGFPDSHLLLLTRQEQDAAWNKVLKILRCNYINMSHMLCCVIRLTQ